MRLLVPDWRPTRQQVLWAIRIMIVFVVVLGTLTLVGLPFDITLWQWLDLLIIPVVLAIGGFLFTRSENRITRVAAEQRAQDEALQAYLHEMGQMLLEKNLRTTEGREVRMLAQARTLTVLTRLDSNRKLSVLQFLYESGLINTRGTVLSLRGADLSGVHMRNRSLRRANLSGTDLSNADLSETDMSEANLTGADLHDANLSKAILVSTNLNSLQLSPLPTKMLQIQRVGFPLVNTDTTEPANLSGVNLSEATLVGADLSETHLSHANLKDAFIAGVNLARADLSGADLSDAYLEGSIFEGAKLIDAKLVRTNLGGAPHEHWDYAEIGQWKARVEMFYLLPENQDPNQETPVIRIEDAILKPPTFSRADLSGADLSKAAAGPEQMEELLSAKLEGATMPNGQKYEDWLKDREGRAEDG